MSEQRPASVLIVDDIVPAVEMLSRLFSMSGYQVFKAYSGQEALQEANAYLPDLILLDVMMPGLSGFEVLERLQASSKTRDIPVIFVTAKDTPSDVEYGLKLGAVDYIPKPIESREILARARSKIEAKRLKEALQQRTRDLEVILRVSNALSTQLELDELLNLILYLTADLTQAAHAVVMYSTPEGRVVKQLPDSRLGTLDPQTLVSLEDNLTQHLQDETIVVYPHGEHEVLGVVLRGDKQSGVLFLLCSQPLSEAQRLLIASTAKQAWLALSNAELYELKAHYAEKLEEEVEKRRQELISTQNLLVRSEKLASVGRLASAIAHEINNPLTPIILNLELVLEDLRAGRMVNWEDVEATYDSAQRIKRIVEQVLQFTRKSRVQHANSIEAVDIAQVINTVAKLSRNYLQHDGITLEVALEEALPMVHGSRDQLEQVLLNLLLNARDALVGGGKIFIRASRQAGNLLIEVEDNGKGIPNEILAHLFEPFTTTKGENGSGLGLFVTHEIITNHQGTIDVTSDGEKGTRFAIRLPHSS